MATGEEKLKEANTRSSVIEALLAGRAHATHELLFGLASNPSTLLDEDDEDDDEDEDELDEDVDDELDDVVDELDELADEVEVELLDEEGVNESPPELPPPQALNSTHRLKSSADCTAHLF